MIDTRLVSSETLLIADKLVTVAGLERSFLLRFLAAAGAVSAVAAAAAAVSTAAIIATANAAVASRRIL